MSGGFAQQVSAIVRKELLVELRTREVLYTMVFFGLVIVVIFGFGLYDRGAATRAAPGVLWASLLLAGTISINRTFDREREGNCITALMLVPGVSWSLFLGKAIANFMYLAITLAVVTPLVLLVFQFDTVPNVWGVVLSLLCGALGYAVLGTLVGGMLGQVQMRGILLPLVLFPMVIPMFGIGVTATNALLTEGDAVSIKVEVPEEPVRPVVLYVSDATIRAEASTPAGIAETLRREVAHAVETGLLKPMRVTGVADEPSFVLLSEPGERLDVSAEGLKLTESEIVSSGWGFLPVLAALDLVLLLIATWLFGKVMDPD